MSTKRTQHYYDEFSRTYSDERRGGYFGFVNALEADVLRDDVPRKRVLELGCGTGLMLDIVSTLGPDWLVGVDLSLGMLTAAAQEERPLVCGSAMQLPFRDGCFDVIYSFKVLSHVPDLPAVLSEVKRILAPNGVAYLELYNPVSIKGVLDRLRGAKRKVFLRHYRPDQVRAMAPPGVQVNLVAGIRIFGLTSSFYTGLLGRVFGWADRIAMRGFFKHVAGYQVYRLQRAGA